MEQLRTNGIFDLREVEFALTETTGQLSICKKTSCETLNPKTAGIRVTETPPPSIVISDRKVLSEGMKNCMLSQKELDRILKKEGYKPEEVFLMTCTPQKDYYIYSAGKKH